MRLLVLGVVLAGLACGEDNRAPAIGYRRLLLPAVAADGSGDTEIPVHVWFPGLADDSGPVTYTLNLAGIILEAPAHPEVRDASPRDGAFPLIIHSHGHRSHPLLEAPELEALAAEGFVVVAPEHRGNTVHDSFDGKLSTLFTVADGRLADVRAVVAATLDRPSAAALDGVAVKTDRYGISGLSLGALTALAFTAGVQDHEGIPGTSDPRLAAVLATAPVRDFFPAQAAEAVSKPLLILAGGADAIAPPTVHAKPLFDRASGTKDLQIRADATHYHFVDVCRMGQSLDDAGITGRLASLMGLDRLLSIRQSACGADAPNPRAPVAQWAHGAAIGHFTEHLK